MTKSRPLIFFACILLLGSAWGADVNTMNEGELSDFITQLITEQQSQLPSTPVIVQIKSDEALNQKIEMIISQLGELKATDERMQEKFNILVTTFGSELDDTEELIVLKQGDKLVEVSGEQTKELKAYVRDQTNPVRMNLPAIGVFLMATALFLILISRTYNFRGKEVHLVPPNKDLEEKAKKINEETEKKVKEEAEKKVKILEQKNSIKRLENAQEVIKKRLEALKNA